MVVATSPFDNAAGGSFGGQNWVGITFEGGSISNGNLVTTSFSAYLFQPAPTANDYAILGPLGTDSTNDGGVADNDGLAGSSDPEPYDMASYVYPGEFSNATSYTVDMGGNTVADTVVYAGFLPESTGSVVEASPTLNLSGAYSSTYQALIAGNDDQAVTLTGSQGGSFSTPFLDLVGQVNVTGGKLSGDFLLIDSDIDPNIYATGGEIPSTSTEIDVSGANASIVSSGSLLIGRSDDLPAELTIEKSATGTFNNVYVGCGDEDSEGTLKIDNAQVQITGFLEVGSGGSGTLIVQDGATLMTGTGQSDTDTGAYIQGADEDDESSATVDGSGSKWINTGNLSIGYYANAPSTLTISNGADVQVTGELILGSGTGSEANVLLESGSTLETGMDVIGDTGNSSALATSADSANLAPLDASGNPGAIIGNAAGSSDTFTITGPNTKWTADSLLINGYQGQGNIVVQKGATLAAQALILGDDNTGTMTVTGDPAATGPPYSGQGSTVTFSGDVVIGENANGTLTVNEGSYYLLMLESEPEAQPEGPSNFHLYFRLSRHTRA